MTQLKSTMWRLVAVTVGSLLSTVAAASTPTTRPAVWKGLDVTGHVREVGTATSHGLAVVFVSTECPISNRYVPQLNQLAKEADGAGVQFFGVISEESGTMKDAAEWGKKYGVEFPVLFDASGEWARRLSPLRTPEAFVLSSDGQVKYRGRIDDGWMTIARKREVVTTHELEDAIRAVAAGSEPKVSRTDAVGCAFEGWDKDGRRDGDVTWARDVAPIVYANCAECHREGEVAPFSLVKYEDVKKRAKQINEVVSEGIMPPWKPAEGYGCFVGERRLSADQRETVKRWVEGGAKEGNAAEAPAVPTWATGWRLGEPDVVVKMPDAFDIPAGGRDIYRAFVMPVELKEDEMIVGFEFRPGNPKVVHHCLLFMDETGKARKLDEADPGPGWRSFGGPGFTPSGGLGGWAPGALAERLPDGMGRPIHKGADVVFQIHYHPDGKPERDQSELALYFAKKPVTKVVGSVPLGRRDIDIPAGQTRYQRHQEVTLTQEMTVVGIIPHMHLLGREMKVTATEPSGRVVPMVWIKDWDFQWQGQYRYAEPLVLPPGTKIEMDAAYDNSDGNPSNPNKPAKEVRFGEQTTDEMCYCFLEIAAPDMQNYKQQRRDVVTQQIVRGILDR